MSYNGCDVFHVTVVPDMVHKSDGNGNLVVFDEQSEGLNLIITPVRLASPSKAIMNTYMQQEVQTKEHCIIKFYIDVHYGELTDA